MCRGPVRLAGARRLENEEQLEEELESAVLCGARRTDQFPNNGIRNFVWKKTDQFASVIVGSDIRLTWDERTEVEEAEPAAEAAMRCGARRVDQIANLNQ